LAGDDASAGDGVCAGLVAVDAGGSVVAADAGSVAVSPARDVWSSRRSGLAGVVCDPALWLGTTP